MKKFNLTEIVQQEYGSKIALEGGSYSLIITAVLLAILIVVNICVSALPTTLTKMDISSSQLYSITSNTKVVVNSLQKFINHQPVYTVLVLLLLMHYQIILL